MGKLLARKKIQENARFGTGNKCWICRKCGKIRFSLNYKTPVDMSWQQLNMTLESKEEAEAGGNDFRVIWVQMDLGAMDMDSICLNEGYNKMNQKAES